MVKCGLFHCVLRLVGVGLDEVFRAGWGRGHGLVAQGHLALREHALVKLYVSKNLERMVAEGTRIRGVRSSANVRNCISNELSGR